MKRLGKVFSTLVSAVLVGAFAMVSVGCPQNITQETAQKVVSTVRGRTVGVTFDSNGGSDMSAVKFDLALGTALKSLPIAPTRAGYDFVGWNTKPDGTGETFTAETVVVDAITLYAKWVLTGNPILINLDYSDLPNGVTITNTPSNIAAVAIGYSYFTVPTLPVVDDIHYFFTGWYDEDGNQVADAAGKLIPNAFDNYFEDYTDEDGFWVRDVSDYEITLYADWEYAEFINKIKINNGQPLVLTAGETKTFYGYYAPDYASERALPRFSTYSEYFEVEELYCEDGYIELTLTANEIPVTNTTAAIAYNVANSYNFTVQVEAAPELAVQSVSVVPNVKVGLGKEVSIPVTVQPQGALTNFSLKMDENASNNYNLADFRFDNETSSIVLKGTTYTSTNFMYLVLTEKGSGIKKNITVQTFVDVSEPDLEYSSKKISSASSTNQEDYTEITFDKEQNYLSVGVHFEAGKTYHIESIDPYNQMGFFTLYTAEGGEIINDFRGLSYTALEDGDYVIFFSNYYQTSKERKGYIHLYYTIPAVTLKNLPSEIYYDCFSNSSVIIPFTYETAEGAPVAFSSSVSDYVNAGVNDHGSGSAELEFSLGTKGRVVTSHDSTLTISEGNSGMQWKVMVHTELPVDGTLTLDPSQSNELDDYEQVALSSSKQALVYAIDLKKDEPFNLETHRSNDNISLASPLNNCYFYLLNPSRDKELVKNSTSISYTPEEDGTYYIAVSSMYYGDSGEVAIHPYERLCVKNIKMSKSYVSVPAGSYATIEITYDQPDGCPNPTFSVGSYDSKFLAYTSVPVENGKTEFTLYGKSIYNDDHVLEISEPVSKFSLDLTYNIRLDPEIYDADLELFVASSSSDEDVTVGNFNSNKRLCVFKLDLEAGNTYVIQTADSIYGYGQHGFNDCRFYFYDADGNPIKSDVDDTEIVYKPTVSGSFYLCSQIRASNVLSGKTGVHAYMRVINSISPSEYEVVVTKENPDKEVQINYSGNTGFAKPELVVYSSDEKIATAEVTYTGDSSATITVHAVKGGSATIDVVDTLSGLSTGFVVENFFVKTVSKAKTKAGTTAADFTFDQFTAEKQMFLYCYEVSAENVYVFQTASAYVNASLITGTPEYATYWVYDEYGNPIYSSQAEEDFALRPNDDSVYYVVVVPDSYGSGTGWAGVNVYTASPTTTLSTSVETLYASPVNANGEKKVFTLSFDPGSRVDFDFSYTNTTSLTATVTDIDYEAGTAEVEVAGAYKNSSSSDDYYITVKDLFSGLMHEILMPSYPVSYGEAYQYAPNDPDDIDFYNDYQSITDEKQFGIFKYNLLYAGVEYTFMTVDKNHRDTLLDDPASVNYYIYDSSWNKKISVTSFADYFTFIPSSDGTHYLYVVPKTQGQFGDFAVYAYSKKNASELSIADENGSPVSYVSVPKYGTASFRVNFDANSYTEFKESNFSYNSGELSSVTIDSYNYDEGYVLITVSGGTGFVFSSSITGISDSISGKSLASVPVRRAAEAEITVQQGRPATLSGYSLVELNSATPAQRFYSVDLTAGTSYQIRLSDSYTADDAGDTMLTNNGYIIDENLFDGKFTLYDDEGNVVENDESVSIEECDEASGKYTPTETGTYYVMVEDYSNETYTTSMYAAVSVFKVTTTLSVSPTSIDYLPGATVTVSFDAGTRPVFDFTGNNVSAVVDEENSDYENGTAIINVTLSGYSSSTLTITDEDTGEKATVTVTPPTISAGSGSTGNSDISNYEEFQFTASTKEVYYKLSTTNDTQYYIYMIDSDDSTKTNMLSGTACDSKFSIYNSSGETVYSTPEDALSNVDASNDAGSNVKTFTGDGGYFYIHVQPRLSEDTGYTAIRVYTD